MSDDQIRAGLRGCLASTDAWPPSLPEFVNRCRPPKRENEAMYRYSPMLPTPVSSKETACEQLAKIRKLVRP